LADFTYNFRNLTPGGRGSVALPQKIALLLLFFAAHFATLKLYFAIQKRRDGI
jgi:hypothetical protein